MSEKAVRIDAVPETVQAVVIEAKADLVDRLGLNPEIVAVTKIERIEPVGTADEGPAYARFGDRALPDYRIFLLAKGVQYVYRTQQGRSPKLAEEKFVL